MDYLRYLLACLGGLVGVYVSVRTGSFLAAFIVLGAVLGVFIRQKQPSHALAFVLWIAAIFFLDHGLGAAVATELALQHPKYSPDALAVGRGLVLLVGLIVFHPLSYGVGRLTIAVCKRLIWRAPPIPSGSGVD